MASETRPGVIVVQELSETPAAVSAPTLVPVVVGPCYQIVEALENDGSLNADAQYADEQYNQVALAIPQADLPDPRSNIDEVNVDESQVDLNLYFGGLLASVARGSNGSTGSSFLKGVNLCAKPALYTDEINGTYDFTSYGDAGALLTLAFDLPSSSVTSNDVTMTFTGSMTATEVADAINGAVGADVAVVIDDSNDYGVTDFTSSSFERVLIFTAGFGATSNITVRANGSALAVLLSGLTSSVDHRIEGAGFRGEDDDDGDLTTPWIEWHRGAYKFGTPGTALTGNASADDAFNTTGGVGPSGADFAGLIDLDGAYTGSKATDVTFNGSAPVVPLEAATATLDGDEFWGDGSQVGDAVVTVVEKRRFKIGVLDNALSTFDGNGDPTSAVYTTLEVNTPSHGTPFSPKYAYFVANNLVYGEVTPEGTASSVTGSVTGLSPQPATVYTSTVSSSWLTAMPGTDVLLSGGTLTIQITEDGVQGDEVTFNFAEGAAHAGAYATVAEIAADLTSGFDGVTVTAFDSDGDGEDDSLVFQTSKTGSDQSISVKTTGTNSIASSLGITSTLTGTGKDYEFAEQAIITGDYITVPLPSDQSAAIEFTVVDSFGTHTFDAGAAATTALADLDALGQAISGDTSHASGVYSVNLNATSGGFEVATLYFIDEDGDVITNPVGALNGRMVIKTTQGGSSVDVSVDSTDDTDLILLGFTDTGFAAELSGDVVDGSSILVNTSGDTLTVNDGTTTWTFTASGDITTAATLVAALNDDAEAQWGGDAAAVTAAAHFFVVPQSVVGTNRIGVRLINGGTLTLGGTQTQSLTGGADVSVAAANNTDTGVDELSGTRLAFTLDENPYVYEIDFTSNSLDEGVDLINTTIGGSSDIASESSGALKLTSSFAGAASRVTIDDTTTAEVTNDNAEDAGTVLGVTSGDSTGSGRPNPDFYQDGSGTVYVGANILRNRSTGTPYSLASALADIYFNYVGLRLDVSAAANDPGLLSFDDVTTMIAAIGPVSTDNPLALACFLQLSNAPSQSVSALGLSETSAAAPLGSVTAHAEALDFLEAKEVYAIAPLTDDGFVHQLYGTHVESMSAPSERGERIAIVWGAQPTRDTDDSIQSGTDAETNGTDNSVTLGSNPVSAIIGAGATDVSALTVDDGIYMEVVIVSLGSTEVRNYSLSSQTGVISAFRTSFASGENDDGFYSSTTMDGDAGYTSMTYAIRKRGELLLVTGTTIPDYGAIATAAAATGASYASRRVFHVYCDSVDTSIDGVVTNVPGYYACAAITGMIAEQPPQQPFTRLSMTGFSKVYGSDDTFSENQMDTIADGGRYILINQGGRIASRHQRSTASTSIEARELSITKAIDYLAKGLRATNRVYIGRYVINPGFIDQLVMSNEGFLARTVQSGVVNSAALKSVLQDESAPDTVLIEVEVAPAYPCNKIRITIVS